MKQTQFPDWQAKAQFLASLIAEPSLQRVDKNLAQGIVQVVMSVKT